MTFSWIVTVTRYALKYIWWNFGFVFNLAYETHLCLLDNIPGEAWWTNLSYRCRNVLLLLCFQHCRKFSGFPCAYSVLLRIVLFRENQNFPYSFCALQVEKDLLAMTTLYSLESTISERKTEIVRNLESKSSWTKKLLLDEKLLCSKVRFVTFSYTAISTFYVKHSLHLNFLEFIRTYRNFWNLSKLILTCVNLFILKLIFVKVKRMYPKLDI